MLKKDFSDALGELNSLKDTFEEVLQERIEDAFYDTYTEIFDDYIADNFDTEIVDMFDEISDTSQYAAHFPAYFFTGHVYDQLRNALINKVVEENEDDVEDDDEIEGCFVTVASSRPTEEDFKEILDKIKKIGKKFYEDHKVLPLKIVTVTDKGKKKFSFEKAIYFEGSPKLQKSYLHLFDVVEPDYEIGEIGGKRFEKLVSEADFLFRLDNLDEYGTTILKEIKRNNITVEDYNFFD
jgi:hypothetical protein